MDVLFFHLINMKLTLACGKCQFPCQLPLAFSSELIPLGSHSLSIRYTATTSAMSLQHICPQFLKVPSVGFCAHGKDLTRVQWWLVSKHICTALSSWKSSRQCSVPRDRLPVLCKPFLQPFSQEAHGQPHGAAGNQSASRNQLLEYEQDEQVKILPSVHVILNTTPYI